MNKQAFTTGKVDGLFVLKSLSPARLTKLNTGQEIVLLPVRLVKLVIAQS
jgi:hypothetical protein